MNNVLLKLATEEDYDVFYKIKSDPIGIKWGGFLKEPDYDCFKAWFLINHYTIKRKIFLAYMENFAVGYIYIDKVKFNVYEISVAILSEYSGKGIGTAIVRNSIDLIKNEIGNDTEIQAYISSANIASMKMFEKNGFIKTNITEYRNLPLVENGNLFYLWQYKK